MVLVWNLEFGFWTFASLGGELVRVDGLEPPTNGLGNRCSIHLSYGATATQPHYRMSISQGQAMREAGSAHFPGQAHAPRYLAPPLAWWKKFGILTEMPASTERLLTSSTLPSFKWL